MTGGFIFNMVLFVDEKKSLFGLVLCRFEVAMCCQRYGKGKKGIRMLCKSIAGRMQWPGTVVHPSGFFCSQLFSVRCNMFSKFGIVDLCAAWIAIGACLVYIGLLCWNGYDDYRRSMGRNK